MRVEKIYSWIIEQLEKNNLITEKDLINNLGPEDVEHAFLFLDYLVTKNMISVNISGLEKEYKLQNLSKIKELLIINEKRTIEEKKRNIQEGIVINVPLNLTSDLEFLKKKYPSYVIYSLKNAITLLLNSAKENVSFALPFFEFDGLNHFVDEFKSLAEKGVNIFVLSRGISKPEREGYTYTEKLKAFSKLIDIYENNRTKPTSKLEIREYGSRIAGYGSASLHYEGIHQKMIIVDKKYAYIGSGEIRAASFLTNGEVGVIHEGQIVNFWDDFFQLFWRNARPVSYEFFAQSLSR